MSEEPKQQSTDTENQATKDEFDNIDFGDDAPPVEEPAETSDEKSTPENKEEGFINQEAVNKRINEITFQKYEEKRKREELEAELNQLKSKIEEKEKKIDDIQIPAMPDVYDDDYKTKIQAREAALQKAAEIKARKAIIHEQEQQALIKKLKEQQEVISRQVNTMFEKGEKLGISKDELLAADKTVSNFVKDPALAKFILAQDDAALIVKYLSSSAQDLEKISRMDSLQASAYIATNISDQANKLKPGVTRTPDPLDIPKGKSAPNEDPYLKGVSFE